MTPTNVKCIDGKRHSWSCICTKTEFMILREHKWCRKCGTLTETVDGRRCDGGEDNNPYAEIPRLVS